MASPACHRLSSLSRLTPDLPHHQHPRLSLLPFPPSKPDPVPISNHPSSFALSPSSTAPNSPFVRKVFEGAVCARSAMDQDFESPGKSTESSVSSCVMSSNADSDEDDTDSSASSSLSELASSSEGPLDSLTSLCAALPIKRGLSRYFTGKSQSFSSLARVSSVAELAKPENPYAKRKRTAMGAELPNKHNSYPPRCAGILKRPTTSSLHKSLKSLPLLDMALFDEHAKLRP